MCNTSGSFFKWNLPLVTHCISVLFALYWSYNITLSLWIFAAINLLTIRQCQASETLKIYRHQKSGDLLFLGILYRSQKADATSSSNSFVQQVHLIWCFNGAVLILLCCFDPFVYSRVDIFAVWSRLSTTTRRHNWTEVSLSVAKRYLQSRQRIMDCCIICVSSDLSVFRVDIRGRILYGKRCEQLVLPRDRAVRAYFRWR